MIDFVWTDNKIKGKILHKLTRKGKFEHSHTALENLHKSFPPEMKGTAKDMSEELIKEGIFAFEENKLLKANFSQSGQKGKSYGIH